DALDGENAIDGGRRRRHTRRKVSCDTQDSVEHRFIQADRSGGSSPLYRQIGIDRAAGNAVGDEFSRRRFDAVPARRQPHPEVEPLGVDRLYLPFESIQPARPAPACKSGHARQRHANPFPMAFSSDVETGSWKENASAPRTTVLIPSE